jgi:hypothetical protein
LSTNLTLYRNPNSFLEPRFCNGARFALPEIASKAQDPLLMKCGLLAALKDDAHDPLLPALQKKKGDGNFAISFSFGSYPPPGTCRKTDPKAVTGEPRTW